MTLEKENDIKTKYELTRLFRILYKAKFYILLVSCLGVTAGFYLKPKDSEIQYYADGIMYTNSTNGEVVCMLMKTLNHMDVSTKARKLNVSKEIASNLLFVSVAVSPPNKVNDNTIIRPELKYYISCYGLKSFKPLYKGIFHYLNSDKYLIDQHKKYLIRRKKREKLINVINLEIDYFEKQYKHNTLYKEISRFTNDNIYRLKIDIDADLSSDNKAITPAFIDIPQKTIIKSHLLISPFVLGFLGAFLGFVCYIIFQNKQLILQEIKIVFQK